MWGQALSHTFLTRRLKWRSRRKRYPQLLRNSCPCTIYPIFSSPPTNHHIFPSMNSSPLRTDFGTCPHSSPMPCSHKRNPVLHIDTSSCFISFVLIRFALPPVLRPAGLHFTSHMFSSLVPTVALLSLRSLSPSYCFPILQCMILYSLFSLVQRCGSLPWTPLRAPIFSPLCTI